MGRDLTKVSFKPDRGRPKRKRVSLACSACRRQKIRCDGLRPRCGTCERRRDVCVYEEQTCVRDFCRCQELELTRIRDSKRFEMDLGTSSPFSGHVNLAFTSPSVPSPVQRVDDEHGSGVTAMGLVSQPPDSAHGSMKEFFGDSSAISFIKQLQDTLRPNAPTGTESNRERRQHRVHGRTSSPRPISSEPWVNSLPPRTLADHLVNCYFAKIHTLYPFVHKYAFLAMYRSLWTAQGFPSGRKPTNGLGLGDTRVNSITFYYALNAIFALGCQFSTVVQAERETTSEAFFRLCKPALDLDSLQGSDLALVQTLLLMVHYLQGSRTPDRCWHVIGTACRVAQAIGLHADSGNSNRSFAEIQIRRRVWHGCVMLDLYAVFSRVSSSMPVADPCIMMQVSQHDSWSSTDDLPETGHASSRSD